MQCYTNEEALASLFLNLSTSFFLLLLLFYSAVSLLLYLLDFIGGYPLLHRNEDGYDSAAWSYDEEEEEEGEEEEVEAFNMSCNTSHHVISRDQDPDHLIADIGDDGESLVFYNNRSRMKEFINVHQTYKHEEEEEEEEDENNQDSKTCSTEEHFSSANVSPYSSESSIEDEDGGVEDLHDDDCYDIDEEDEEVGRVSRYDVVGDLIRKQPNTSSTRGPSRLQSGLVFDDKRYNGIMISPPHPSHAFYFSSHAN